MSANEKKLKAETLAVSTLLNDNLFHIFGFVGASELHYSVPLVCKQFRNCLKQKWTEETSGSAFFDNHSCVRENVLWKNLYRKHAPEIDRLTKDHYYCYRKMFLNRFQPPKLLFCFVESITDLFSDAEEMVSSLKKTIGAAKANKSFADVFKMLSSISDNLESMHEQSVGVRSRLGSAQQQIEKKKTKPGTPVSLDGFYDLDKFFADTAYASYKMDADSKNENIDFDGYIRIFSPFNLRSALVHITSNQEAYESLRDDGLRVDNPSYTISFSLYDTPSKGTRYDFHASGGQDKISAQDIWRVIKHLEIEKVVTEPSQDAFEILLEQFFEIIGSAIHYWKRGEACCMEPTFDTIEMEYVTKVTDWSFLTELGNRDGSITEFDKDKEESDDKNTIESEECTTEDTSE
jgi:hypothetical protein